MSDPAPTEEIGFLLLPEFPIYALILAVEALRVANQNAGRRLFATRLFTADGKPVAAGSGAELAPDSGIAEVRFCPTVLVVAGNQPTQHLGRGLLAAAPRSTGTARCWVPSTPAPSRWPPPACSTATGSPCTGRRCSCSWPPSGSRSPTAVPQRPATASPAQAASPRST
ncbi:MAG: hypothetical protein U1E17_21820 [Geminicoccaceae bacterium]